MACQDWAATKAADRVLDNDRVNEQKILAGHFHATRQRFTSTDGPILVLHDTTEFSYTRNDTQAMGQIRKVAGGQPKDRDPIDWKLITNLPVRNKAEVIEKLDWYSPPLGDRNLSQDSQVRLPRGRLEAAHRAAIGQPDRDSVHCVLAGALADNGQPLLAQPIGSTCGDRDRNPTSRSPHSDE